MTKFVDNVSIIVDQVIVTRTKTKCDRVQRGYESAAKPSFSSSLPAASSA